MTELILFNLKSLVDTKHLCAETGQKKILNQKKMI